MKDPVEQKVLQIHAGALAVVSGLLCGLAVFGATAVLLLKGGENVGAHLQLLGQFFPGYTVSWGGSLIGFAYAAVTGGLAGWLVGVIYTAVANRPRLQSRDAGNLPGAST